MDLSNRIAVTGTFDDTKDFRDRRSYDVDQNDDDADVDAESHISNDDEEGFDTTSVLKNGASKAAVAMTASERIAQREARFVRCLRLGLLGVLLTASAIAAAMVYVGLAEQEEADFEEAVADYSRKLTDQFQLVAVRCIGAIGAFSATITSHMVSSNATWPFVTIPNYEAQVRHISELANIETLAFAPIITTEERNEWETSFVSQNLNPWVQESIATQQMYEGYINETLLSYEVKPIVQNETSDTNGYSTTIFGTIYPPSGGWYFDTSTQKGPYLPLWQISPFQPGRTDSDINFDLNTDSNFDGNVIEIISERQAALGRYTTNGYGKDDTMNPATGFYYPVLKDTPHNSTVGGTLVTLIYWMRFFSNVLPPSASGLIGVLGNSCNQTFTFRIDGVNVYFVGDNDLHDSNYDYLKQEVSFLTSSNENKEYLGFPIDDTGCDYTLSVYPSDDLHNKYVTNIPVIASVVILLVFIVTSSLFVLYDCLVQRRQRIVQKEAESSGAIVSSLFPEAYRERLMAAQTNTNANAKKLNSKESMLHNFLSSGGGEHSTGLDQAIADLYPECTVFFADIAGFTQWSSTREPVEVFCLLQELFAAMDRSAKKYHVFKVETIGDCYMAVTGLPNPQPNHALLMSRFATDCLIQMNETTTRLMGTLGDDTANLALRIGLHSGPVTAGILRGEKSRFQLFGDTVNTASRMESTGEKSRIQLSSTTATLLRDSGKGHWLKARDDLVEAKGKGKMQTYWLLSDRGQQSSTSKESATLRNTDIDPTDHEEISGVLIDI